MSGPKVIRLVTREEAEAACRLEIATFAAAAQALLATVGQEAGEGLDEELARRRAQLEQLFAAGRFVDLQKEAPRQAAFLRHETERREKAARERVRSERGRRRRLAEAAASVARAFPQAAVEMRQLAARALTQPAAALEAEQQALDRAWRTLASRPAESAMTVEERELAARLGAGEKGKSLAVWLESRPAAAAKPRDLRLDGALAELEALGGEEASRGFAERAAALLAENEERQGLLADSLLLEIGTELRRRREESSLRQRLAEARAKLAASALAAPLAASLGDRVEAALAVPAAGAEALLAEVRQALDRSLAELAAEARRRAVLEGLATLGYEVRQDLTTAWVDGGRIVVQKPPTSDYGVELGAPADASRFQVRLVGAENPAAPRSKERDRDQERIWCQDFERLRALLAEEGADTVVERAQAPGEVPVKSVPPAVPAAETAGERLAPALRRTFPPR